MNSIENLISQPSSLSSSPDQFKRSINMKDVAAIILGGGQGARLSPLTISRCKPALCYGGRYRLVDIPISNAIHSGCQKIFLITQFLSSSLHRHILSTYRFGNSTSSAIELLSAEEKPQRKTWFQGTADAVRQNLNYLEDTHADYFLILSGDQLYQMDYNDLLQRARETDADMVISCLPVNEKDTSRMGIMQVDKGNFITDFKEKPQLEKELKQLILSKSQLNKFGINTKNLNYLGSMGIYLFKRQVLIDLLMDDLGEDFGKHLIPHLVQKGRVAAHIHRGYWEDIGTIESFYSANMALTEDSPPFDCYNENWPIFTKPVTLPGAKVFDAQVSSSLLCEGAIIEAAEIINSIIGPRTVIKSGTKIHNTYIMGNDFFKTHQNNLRLPSQLHIGKNCTINKAIIDRHVSIGNNVQLINKGNLSNYDGNNINIRDGVIVVQHGATIPDNFIL
ncbi:MAG TPA: glucose-1-phosphate adenylyltransferase [Parachlamydiaceae bacterium]|nr:glucose-1-phosphate adenylyltransferase [Parachlamydiaceae bacterium]